MKTGVVSKPVRPAERGESFSVAVRLFDLGQIVARSSAVEAWGRTILLRCLQRHVRGDWGCVDFEDGNHNFSL